MSKRTTSLICTVLNEEKTIGKFLDSIARQSKLPDEIIIVDGGSTDKTIQKISEFKFPDVKNFPNIKLLFKNGNRSVGRNEGIEHASGEIILMSDSGCILDKDWIKNILKPFTNKKVDVVAGYYKGLATNAFQKSLIPYVLVMEDKINKDEFLPATRSMAIKKSVWKKLGGFNEKFSHNEDYAFANALRKAGVRIIFEKDAIVNWIPRVNLPQAFKMFFRFALGDAQARLFREKVIYIFLRYILGVYLLLLSIAMRSMLLSAFIGILLLGYIYWAINKNYRYVNDKKAFVYLPMLQFASDLAVILGTSLGLVQLFSLKNIVRIVAKHKILTIIIAAYSLVVLALLQWGIPNANHPFNYAMDEWHFAQALRTFFKYGTGSIAGAASIPLYHIVSSIAFLIPFYVLRLVDPLAIKYTLDNIVMQHTLFEVLRLHTLFYGILSTIVIYSLLKQFTKLAVIFVALFVFSPIWISLTNYYKYDITLIFWISSTLYLLTKYFKTQQLKYFIFSGIACGLALSTKFTAAPLIVAYVIGYFILSQKISYRALSIGVLVSFFVFATFGIPDLILNKGNYFQLLYSTLVQSPQYSLVYSLEYPAWFFLLAKEFPSIFGYFLAFLFYVNLLALGCLMVLRGLNKEISKYRFELFIFISTVLFILSTIAFNIDGGGNRALVLIPFMAIIPVITIERLFKRYKKLIIGLLLIGIVLQVAQTATWISVKFYPDPRETSSDWILKNIPSGSQIGIENIPIYQMLPDFILKEFYAKEHDQGLITRYNYSIVSAKDTASPKYVIITNDFDNMDYIKISPKKDLMNKLFKENYKRIKVFSPDLRYYNVFADKRYFILTNIMAIPVSISIYEK